MTGSEPGKSEPKPTSTIGSFSLIAVGGALIVLILGLVISAGTTGELSPEWIVATVALLLLGTGMVLIGIIGIQLARHRDTLALELWQRDEQLAAVAEREGAAIVEHLGQLAAQQERTQYQQDRVHATDMTEIRTRLAAVEHLIGLAPVEISKIVRQALDESYVDLANMIVTDERGHRGLRIVPGQERRKD